MCNLGHLHGIIYVFTFDIFNLKEYSEKFQRDHISVY